MPVILGINMSCRDTSACLIVDGEIRFAVREERLNREKKTRQFPVRSIKACLDHIGITIEDIDAVAVSWNPAINLERLSGAQSGVARYKPEHFYGVPSYLFSFVENKATSYSMQEFLFEGGKRLMIYYINHHESHASESFYLSHFDNSAILTMDAYGEKDSIGMWSGRGNKIGLIKTVEFPHSLGSLYGTFTQYLGFTPDSDEWKVMGASAYGDPERFYKPVKEMINLEPDGFIKIDTSYFYYHLFSRPTMYSAKFVEVLGPPRRPDEEMTQRHFDIAAALQRITEDAIFHLLAHLHQITGEKNICLSGGVAMNCIANGKVLERTPFENIFISSSPDDGGTSIGAAQCLYYNILNNKRMPPPVSNYLGYMYSDEAIERELNLYGIGYERTDNPALICARLISQGKIAGWFQDRMEFGERALGNRSILCDPRDAKMKDRVNSVIKFRENFRPFAPSILEEYTDEYFINATYTPYMEKAFSIRGEKRNLIPAVTHFDGTGRLQTVRREVNPLFYELIDEFYKITGVPVVMNTSFNLQGEPIVCTPKDAIRTFYSSGLDALIIGNYIIEKSKER